MSNKKSIWPKDFDFKNWSLHKQRNERMKVGLKGWFLADTFNDKQRLNWQDLIKQSAAKGDLQVAKLIGNAPAYVESKSNNFRGTIIFKR